MLMILASCVKKESSFDQLQNKKIPADSFFQKVIALNPTTKDEDDAFYIDYNWNSQTKTIEITKVTEKELDFWPFTSKAERKELILGNKYNVTCTKGGKDIWTKTCDGKFSCGSLVKDCLEKEKGCATVCANKMVFIPKNREFFLLDDE